MSVIDQMMSWLWGEQAFLEQSRRKNIGISAHFYIGRELLVHVFCNPVINFMAEGYGVTYPPR